LAGADRPGERAQLLEWATSVRLAGAVDITNDAALLLAAGTPAGWGLAVIAGTGSIAFARNAHGDSFRAGGWGPLLGDEGSAYKLTLAALQFVALAADGGGLETALTERFLEAFNVSTPQALVPIIYGGMDRPALAALARIVIQTAEKDDVIAREIVQDEATALAMTARLAWRRAFGQESSAPIALAGGMVTSQPYYRTTFLEALAMLGMTPNPLTIVTEPAEGALRLAQRVG
jgi:N-acetylglucosamine kinase-like BadF-type ATPase